MTWPFKISPYAVQTKALQRADGRYDFAYFMEMGLGKTAVVLAEYVRLREAGLVDGLVIICPNSLKQTWADQATKFDAGISPVIWPVDTVIKTAAPWMLVMNYEAVITMRGGKFLLTTLRAQRCMLVLDESVHIKNYKARRTKTLIAAAEYATYRRILSGKPLVQGAHDLWAQLRFINGAGSMNYFQFRAKFCVMGGYLGKQVVGVQDAARLHNLVDASAFRATKKAWLDLPKKIYQTRQIEMTTQQTKHYRELHDDLYTKIKNEEIAAPMMITAMLKMQQVTSGFIITGSGPIDIDGANPKLHVLMEALEEVDGKTIIFCYFRYSVEKILKALDQKSVGAVGMMEGYDARAAVDAFNNNSTCRCLVAQVNTGKYGHTLLGDKGDDRCHTTVFYENSYSLDARAQAEDRNHRIGQDEPVVYIDLVASELDKAVIKALQRKEDVASAVIDDARKE